MRAVPAFMLALSLAAPAAAQVMTPPPPAGRIVEGFLPHRATYDLKLKSARWSSSISSLSGRLVSEFDDVCAGFTFNQRLVTDLVDGEGKASSGNFWVSTYESADGAAFRFSRNNTVDGVPVEQARGTASRAGDGTGKVVFTLPDGKTASLPAGVIFPTEFMGRVVAAALAGKRSLSIVTFEGNTDGKIYDAFAAIGAERAAAAGDLGVPGGEALEGLKAWPVTISYYVRGEKEDLPEYETSFTMFENGVTSAVTLDYGDFTLAGTLRRIDALKKTDCAG